MGFTGMGGGLIMTPLLIFAFGINPAVAIGTDLVYASLTKLFGSWQHWRQKTVNWLLVGRLLSGSIPGSFAGAFLIFWLKRHSTFDINQVLSHLLGWTFVLVAVLMIGRVLKEKMQSPSRPARHLPNWALVALGFVGGLLVSLTSVGSGTLFIAMLTILTTMRASEMVGTDLVHGAILTFVAGMGHLAIGTVDLNLAGMLLAGSIPGILIGSRLTLRLPDLYIRWGLVSMLVISGIKLVWG
jgi:hypothetical protein